MRIERRIIDVDGVPIAFQMAGHGQPVVLLHGLSASTRWWAKNVPFLAGHFKVFVIDLIGFGHSRGPRPFVLSDAARQVTLWMDLLELERASIVGHSMGGFIAADLAASFPRRVERMVLADAAILPGNYGYIRQALGLTRALGHTPIRFLPILAGDAVRAGPSTVWSAAHQLLTADIGPKLERIDAPTLLVWGEYDTLVPIQIGRQLAAHLPNSQFTVIKGAGHNPMWERPDAFNDVVVNFFTAPFQAEKPRTI